MSDERPLVAHFVVELNQLVFFVFLPFYADVLAADVVFVSEYRKEYLSRHCFALFRGKLN